MGADLPDRDIAATLLERNYLTIDRLRAILRSAVEDAVTALTEPTDEDSFVSHLRFVAEGGHWAGALCRLGVGSVRAEDLRRAGGLCVPEDLPRRAPAGKPRGGREFMPAPPELLRRIRDGLRSIS